MNPVHKTAKKNITNNVAFHESAHAVVAELGGVPVDYIDVIPVPANRERGHCHLTEPPIPNRVTGFFYFLSGLASFPTEKLLGIDTTRIVLGCFRDWTDVLGNVYEDNQTIKKEWALVGIYIVSEIVKHPDVWRAIESVATCLLKNKRLEGDEVRRIIRQHIREELFTGEKQQALLESTSNLVDYVLDVFGSDIQSLGEMWEGSDLEGHIEVVQEVLSRLEEEVEAA